MNKKIPSYFSLVIIFAVAVYFLYFTNFLELVEFESLRPYVIGILSFLVSILTKFEPNKWHSVDYSLIDQNNDGVVELDEKKDFLRQILIALPTSILVSMFTLSLDDSIFIISILLSILVSFSLKYIFRDTLQDINQLKQ